mmetsp:Transcript_108994/g.209421  ORF Transcript_108994/g.209421 Transcript_108994/m.209421 type:complete len:296 (-) Transcript_108994:126-1013(-)
MTYKDVSDPLASNIDLRGFLMSLATKTDVVGAHGGTRSRGMQMAAPMAARMGSSGSSVDDPSAAADGDSDVHFHTFKSVKLQPHTRISLPIFRQEATFKDVYRCKGGMPSHYRTYEQRDNENDDVLEVWHALQVMNSTAKPWTTAPIMITSEGQYQCGSQMFYTPVRSEALVEMTKALSVQVKRETTAVPTQEVQEVLGRQCSVIMQSTVFTIQNGKSVDVHLVLDFPIAGEVVSNSCPLKKKVEKRKCVGELNVEHALQVEVRVPARDKASVTIQSKLYQELPEKLVSVPTLQR